MSRRESLIIRMVPDVIQALYSIFMPQILVDAEVCEDVNEEMLK